MNHHFVVSLCSMFALSCLGQAQEALFKADFKQSGEWTKENISVVSEGEPYLRLTADKPELHVMSYRKIALPEAQRPAALRLVVRYRGVEIVHGKEKWHNGHIMVKFKDKEDKAIGGNVVDIQVSGTTEWQTAERIFAVPASASAIELMPYMLLAASGHLDISRLDVLTASAEELPEPPEPLRSEPLPPFAPSMPALNVSGNRLVTDGGAEVLLQGVCVDSLQWNPAGEHIVESIRVAVKEWHANVLRLPVTDEFWFGRHKSQKDRGFSYRTIVDEAIRRANGLGAYVVLDLHCFKVPEASHMEFWQDAATRYAAQTGMIFELFNEPHSIQWEEWQTTMQGLLDAVRGTGAAAVVVAGGLDWGYDLSKIADGSYGLKDTAAGRGIIYSSHIYPWKFDWEKKVLCAVGKYPLFIGEVGNPKTWDDFKFIEESARKVTVGVDSTWPKEVLGFIQENRLNWTGFSFHPKCGPAMLSDWNYTPTPYWGVYVKEALAGRRFTAVLH